MNLLFYGLKEKGQLMSMRDDWINFYIYIKINLNIKLIEIGHCKYSSHSFQFVYFFLKNIKLQIK